ncbi:MAG: cobyrinate a,c-diamide synthase [Pseudomonadota bacterium]
MKCPGIVISALRGGSGKTILTIGLIAALRQRGHVVTPFKKGPDYIDAGWLGLAAGRPCYNLDTFLLDAGHVRRSFLSHTNSDAVAVIEGNRGLYDAIDTEGSTSTAELAKLLNLPVIMIIDCTKTTRTMAAVVSGCRLFDPQVNIRGVVLNRVAGTRHESILRRSIEEHCGIPVIGAIPKLKKDSFPERHMGLVPSQEHAWALAAVAAAADMAARHIDLAAILNMAENDARCLPPETVPQVPPKVAAPAGGSPRIGIIKDSAFQFYYPENIDALADAGAQIVFTSPLDEETLPALDGLYIGGGFPETHAEALAANRTYREAVKTAADAGMPIYGECGGLMYLGRQLVLGDTAYPMTGALPIVFGFSKRPQGHGYTVVSVDRPNPFYSVGREIRGHEFHYSSVLQWDGTEDQLVFRMIRGSGITGGRDGVCYKNVLATYSHTHALGNPGWAQTLVAMAVEFRNRSAGGSGD